MSAKKVLSLSDPALWSWRKSPLKTTAGQGLTGSVRSPVAVVTADEGSNKIQQEHLVTPEDVFEAIHTSEQQQQQKQQQQQQQQKQQNALELDLAGNHNGPEGHGKWTPCHQFPSQIQVELMDKGVIPDPFKGMNEAKVGWVGETDWLYKANFTVPLTSTPIRRQQAPEVEIVFEGLDTFATVWLNGTKILQSDNMFVPHRINITRHLHLPNPVIGENKNKKVDPENELVILFTSAFLHGKQIEQNYLSTHLIGSQKMEHLNLWNGDASRLFVRKAGYNYGWDWGPVLMTCGVWKPVFLEIVETRHGILAESDDLMTSEKVKGKENSDEIIQEEKGVGVRIGHVWPKISVDKHLDSTLQVEVELVQVGSAASSSSNIQGKSTPRSALSLKTTTNITLIDPDSRALVGTSTDDALTAMTDNEKKPAAGRKAIRKFAKADGEESILWKFKKGEIDLWWSVGMKGEGGGKPKLYEVLVEMLDEHGHILDSHSQKIGFRRLRIKQEPLIDQQGTSFCLEINNVPIFIGGSNWIPIDSFLTNATKDRYRAWLQLMIEGNQNMIRSWAGGVYESDDFFNLCDEMGILVWQDFLFGCGQYPAYPEFLESVRQEAEAVVKRIRHHPSLAIFAGNNEDYQVAESCKLEWNPEDKDGDYLKTDFPAREIYERLLPGVVHQFSETFYHPGSPWGGSSTRDQTVGDIHQWNVWHGSQEAYQDWDKLGGRFVSEFGMQGLPDRKTVDYWLDGEKNEAYPQSKTVGYHNKADGAERRLETYLVENIRHAFDMDSYIYATQLIQAETLSTAYRLWRREFKGPGREYTAGALVWQLNDVYPCTSWSIVDYFLRPKPAYYSIKQSMAPIAVGMKRYTIRTYPIKHSAANFTDTHYVDIWAANSTLKSITVKVIVEAYILQTGEKIWFKEADAILGVNRGTELDKIQVPFKKVDESASIVVSTRLVESDVNSIDPKVLSRFVTFPEPYKFLTFPTTEQLELVVNIDYEKSIIKIKAACPIKGFILYFDRDVTLSDNALDIIPGDERVVNVKGLTSDTQVSWRYLGDAHVP